MPINATEPQEEQDDQPPILGSWRNVYIFVLALHLFIIYLFFRFGEAFA